MATITVVVENYVKDRQPSGCYGETINVAHYLIPADQLQVFFQISYSKKWSRELRDHVYEPHLNMRRDLRELNEFLVSEEKMTFSSREGSHGWIGDEFLQKVVGTVDVPDEYILVKRIGIMNFNGGGDSYYLVLDNRMLQKNRRYTSNLPFEASV